MTLVSLKKQVFCFVFVRLLCACVYTCVCWWVWVHTCLPCVVCKDEKTTLVVGPPLPPSLEQSLLFFLPHTPGWLFHRLPGFFFLHLASGHGSSGIVDACNRTSFLWVLGIWNQVLKLVWQSPQARVTSAFPPWAICLPTWSLLCPKLYVESVRALCMCVRMCTTACARTCMHFSICLPVFVFGFLFFPLLVSCFVGPCVQLPTYMFCFWEHSLGWLSKGFGEIIFMLLGYGGTRWQCWHLGDGKKDGYMSRTLSGAQQDLVTKINSEVWNTPVILGPRRLI